MCFPRSGDLPPGEKSLAKMEKRWTDIFGGVSALHPLSSLLSLSLVEGSLRPSTEGFQRKKFRIRAQIEGFQVSCSKRGKTALSLWISWENILFFYFLGLYSSSSPRFLVFSSEFLHFQGKNCFRCVNPQN